MTAAGSPLGPVVLIGAGLVGASIGQALTRAGETVHLVDANPAHARVAAERGAGTLTSVAAPHEVGLVIVAVPPRAIAGVVDEALDTYRSAAVTDVGSVKEPMLRELMEHRSLGRYVGSHPMAGSHLPGPLAADPELFVDRTWAITPHPDAEPAAVAAVTRLAELCGARVISLAPDEHDRAVGRVSHLPHLVSAAMAGHLLGVPPEELSLAGQGLRDVTRIAGSDPALWQQIVSANARMLVPELRALTKRLTVVADQLAEPGADVAQWLGDGVAGTRRLPGKHGRAPVDYAEVVVEIPDAPGSLARLFADVDAAGVNVEDIAIEHDPARLVGHLRLSVRPERRAELDRVMTGSGWTVRPA